ncbi:hypothetical protein CHS0354_035881 [Potamilus streckersoni]|uniref:Fibrinogen C-terminal domain-containing protein n=1 Tax=Potamilus streckersoni TaxID=2493646 RepID=A0AAE0SRC6_9BIVA|nr:hypothetical protein CHS0354_035881 [Potamilus streckersoni]
MTHIQSLLTSLGDSLNQDLLDANNRINSLSRQVNTLQGQIHSMADSRSNATLDQIMRDIESLRARMNLLSGAPDMRAMILPKSLDGKEALGVDCASLFRRGTKVSGVYTLQPDPADNSTRFDAYCDMENDGGGWTVIQRRIDGSDDFYRGWESYKIGFGNFLHDFWLGLDNIHLLTKFGNNKMRIDLWNWENMTRFGEFNFVRIADEKDKYRILVGGYQGNSGNPFHTPQYSTRMQSMQFSTFDNDNDMDPGNCARTFTSGWWFNRCYRVNLNGVWYADGTYFGPATNGIVWDLWVENGPGYSLQAAEMKLRPSNF